MVVVTMVVALATVHTVTVLMDRTLKRTPDSYVPPLVNLHVCPYVYLYC